MSLADSQKKIAVNELLSLGVRQTPAAVSSLKVALDNVELLILNVHDSIINDLGTYGTDNRSDLDNIIGPQLATVLEIVNRAVPLSQIFDEDPEVYRANFEAYITANPDTYAEAVAKIDK